VVHQWKQSPVSDQLVQRKVSVIEQEEVVGAWEQGLMVILLRSVENDH